MSQKNTSTAETFYNDWNAFFLADPFEAEFTDLQGNIITDTVSGASVYIAIFPVNEYTREPIYDVNTSGIGEYIEAHPEYANCFDASINAETGVVIIPKLAELMCYKDTHEGQELACKITEYTIDTGEDITEPHEVCESEFLRIIKEHFSYFNNSDNYRGQGLSYGYNSVTDYYPRRSYAVGYDEEEKAIYAPYGPEAERIATLYAFCSDEETAQKYVEEISSMTPSEMQEQRRKENQERMKALFEKYAKENGSEPPPAIFALSNS